METEDPQIVALYLRDYFWRRNPAESIKKEWRRVQCATLRIAESFSFMSEMYSFETRLAAAKRVRRAARECVKLIPGFCAEEWTLVTSMAFELMAQTIIAMLDEAPSGAARQH